MKRLLSLTLLLIFSCSSDNGKPESGDQDIIGKWQIIEQLLDPGDGSGTFQPVSSNRTFEFFSDGTVTVNGLMCYMSDSSLETSSGTYEFFGDLNTDLQFEGTIYPDNCDFPDTTINFNITEEGNLVLWYLCIEPCGEKYKKTS